MSLLDFFRRKILGKAVTPAPYELSREEFVAMLAEEFCALAGGVCAKNFDEDAVIDSDTILLFTTLADNRFQQRFFVKLYPPITLRKLLDKLYRQYLSPKNVLG